MIFSSYLRSLAYFMSFRTKFGFVSRKACLKVDWTFLLNAYKLLWSFPHPSFPSTHFPFGSLQPPMPRRLRKLLLQRRVVCQFRAIKNKWKRRSSWKHEKGKESRLEGIALESIANIKARSQASEWNENESEMSGKFLFFFFDRIFFSYFLLFLYKRKRTNKTTSIFHEFCCCCCCMWESRN